MKLRRTAPAPHGLQRASKSSVGNAFLAWLGECISTTRLEAFPVNPPATHFNGQAIHSANPSEHYIGPSAAATGELRLIKSRRLTLSIDQRD